MSFTIKFASIAAVGFVLYCFPYAADGAGAAVFDPKEPKAPPPAQLCANAEDA